MRLALITLLCSVAGCSAAATSDDAGPIVHTCSDAITAVAATSCSTECTTAVPCDFTDRCTRPSPSCPSTSVSCVSGRVSLYVSGIICLDAGALDASTDGDAGVSIVHTCDDARSMLAGRDCRFGCDAGGTPCDFTGQCCVQPSVFVGCEGGHVITSEVGHDAGPCDWDASLDTATRDGG